MTKLVVNTEFPELVRFLFPELREEKSFPMRDGFFLKKNLTGREQASLERFNNYVIVSQNYFTEVWGKQEIFNYIAAKINSKRKPKFELMPKEEFEKNVKVFAVCKVWVTEDEESNMFELYQSIDNAYRYKRFFEVKAVTPSVMIFYSLLTFINKAMTVTAESMVGKGYFRVLQSKKRRISENFKNAITTYTTYGKEVDEDFKVLRFLIDIGG